MKKLCLLPIAALMACTPATEEEAVENDVVEEVAAAPAGPAFDMDGSYRVASYRGAPIPGTAAMNASIGDGQITISSPCARMVWSYELSGNVLATEPVSGLSGGCAADGSTFENGVAGVVGQANIAMEMRGMTQISGPGGDIQLEPR